LGSNLFNLLILGLDDVFYRQGPLMADAGTAHSISVVAIVMMNALFLIGLTYKALTKRFLVTWDSAAIGGVYVVAVALSYLLTG
jgi:cation:H+ antiporter